MITLLAYGGPVQAMVAAFGRDERTVADGQRRAGRQGERVQDHLVQAGRVHRGQVHADELRVRVVGGVVWLAMSISVTSRLWLGGAVSVRRDRALIRAALTRVAACGPVAALLLCTDGLASYPRQAMHRFRPSVRTGGRGRPRLVLPDALLIAHAAQRAPVKRYARRRVCAVERRIVRGSAAAVATMLTATQGKETAVINTADIERLNATFRARLAPLARRSRATIRQVATLTVGMWLVGRVDNLCTPHRSLDGWTPAQAARLTDHRWTVHELLTFPLPLPALKRRGRPPQWLRELPDAA